MKRMLATLMVVAAGITGCSDPKELALPSSLAQVEQVKEKIAKLPETDRKMLLAYLARREMANQLGAALGRPDAGSSFTAATIGDAIKQQSEYEEQVRSKEAEEKALKEKILAEQKAIQEQVDKTLTVAVVKLGVIPKDAMSGRYSDEQTIDLALKNSGSKEIAAVSGSIVFLDMFEKEVGQIGFQYDDGIKPGETAEWSGSRRINQFDDQHMAIARLSDGKYTTKFVADGIVFSDGTKLIPSK